MKSACDKFVKYLKSQPAGKDFDAKAVSTDLLKKCLVNNNK